MIRRNTLTIFLVVLSTSSTSDSVLNTLITLCALSWTLSSGLEEDSPHLAPATLTQESEELWREMSPYSGDFIFYTLWQRRLELSMTQRWNSGL